MEEMTAFASSSEAVRVRAGTSAVKINFHLLVLIRSKLWVRVLQLLSLYVYYYYIYNRCLSEAVRSAQKDINLLKNMILTRFDCLDSSIAQLSAVVTEVPSTRHISQKKLLTHSCSYSNQDVMQITQKQLTHHTMISCMEIQPAAMICSEEIYPPRCDAARD